MSSIVVINLIVEKYTRYVSVFINSIGPLENV